MKEVNKSLVEYTKDNEIKLLWDANNKLFNAPTVVYYYYT